MTSDNKVAASQGKISTEYELCKKKKKVGETGPSSICYSGVLNSRTYENKSTLNKIFSKTYS